MNPIRLALASFATSALLSAQAGDITAHGSVTALTDVSQLKGIKGLATFDLGLPEWSNVPLDAYAASGMVFLGDGTFDSFGLGVTEPGFSITPSVASTDVFIGAFADPIAGGGTTSRLFGLNAGVVKFTTLVTQAGLTAGRNGNQFLVAWDTTGKLLGQVNWEPFLFTDAAFVGIDTQGVPIGMLAYGNDNIMAGAAYDVGGATIMSDDWRWASGISTPVVPEGSSVALWGGLATTGMLWLRTRRSGKS